MSPQEIVVQLLEELRQEFQVETSLCHVAVNLLNDMLGSSQVELLPSLEEEDVVAGFLVSREELHGFLESSIFNELLVWIVGADQVGNSGFRLVLQFWTAY
jgi:hypothetical protein